MESRVYVVEKSALSRLHERIKGSGLQYSDVIRFDEKTFESTKMHTATITVSAGVLGMPVSFSVTSEPQTTKKGAEHQAAEMALEMLAPPPAEEALQLDASPEAAAVAGVRSACERCEPDLASLLADAASSGHQQRRARLRGGRLIGQVLHHFQHQNRVPASRLRQRRSSQQRALKHGR